MSNDDDHDNDAEDGVDLVVPSLGEGVTEATLMYWLARSGDQVTHEQPIVALSLDKVDVELEAPAAGMLVVRHAPNAVLKIGDVIARVIPAPPANESLEARHAALLAAVAVAPDDDGARQVYADFLLVAACPLGPWGAETTLLRGEYLGLVARLRRPHPEDDVAALTRRRAELEYVARETAASLVPIAGTPRIEEGFVVGFATDVATLVASHHVLFSRAPIRALSISNIGGGDPEALLELPRLEQLRELRLEGRNDGSLSSEALTRFVGSPRLAAVRQLVLSDVPGIDLGDRTLDRLELQHFHEWTAAELVAAINRPLRELVLSGRGAPPPLDGTSPGRLALHGFDLAALSLSSSTDLVRLELVDCRFRDRDAVLATIAALPPTLGVLVLHRTRVGSLPIVQIADELRTLTSVALAF